MQLPLLVSSSKSRQKPVLKMSSDLLFYGDFSVKFYVTDNGKQIDQS